MLDTEASFEPVERGDEGFPLSVTTSSTAPHRHKTQDFLKEEHAEGASRFRTEDAPPGPRGEGTLGLDDVSVVGTWNL
jgi:hypothetical protein